MHDRHRPSAAASPSPEAGNDRRFPLQRFVTVDWNTPVSNRLLIEASGIHRVERWGGMDPQVGKLGNIDHLTTGHDLGHRQPQPGDRRTADLPGRRHLQQLLELEHPLPGGGVVHHRLEHVQGGLQQRATAITRTRPTARRPMPYSYNFTSMVPERDHLPYRAAHRRSRTSIAIWGSSSQDKWTTGRWTLAGAIRFDSFKNSFPEQSIVGTFFGRSLNIQYDEIDNLSWNDVTPRLGATYDVFGNGKTAFKVTLNKYLEGLGTTGFGAAQVSDAPNPINRLSNQATRVWADNSNFVPNCDLNNFAANGECLAVDNPNFGTVMPGTTYDPDLMTGWGKRANNWEFTTSVQQEIIPRMSLEVQYARRWYGNIRLMDDLAATPADYTPFTITAPSDSRLPDGGGYTLTGWS